MASGFSGLGLSRWAEAAPVGADQGDVRLECEPWPVPAQAAIQGSVGLWGLIVGLPPKPKALFVVTSLKKLTGSNGFCNQNLQKESFGLTKLRRIRLRFITGL